MRYGWVKIFLASGLMSVAAVALANDSYQDMAIQQTILYSEPWHATEEVRSHYLSRGQEYLRNYMRTYMLKYIAANWLEMDMQTMQAGVAVDLSEALLNQDKDSPWRTKLKVYADENLNRYIDCGRFWPMEVEMESSYAFMQNMTLRAKMDAPFNDLLRLSLGSEMDLAYGLTTNIQYQICNSSQYYDGLGLGLGFWVSDWLIRWDYNLTPQFDQLLYFNLANHF